MIYIYVYIRQVDISILSRLRLGTAAPGFWTLKRTTRKRMTSLRGEALASFYCFLVSFVAGRISSERRKQGNFCVEIR